MSDSRREAPAVARNRDAILAVLEETLPSTGLVLEIASGTGEHAVHFARALPDLEFATSDPSAEARTSTAAWCAHEALPNLRRPVELDVRAESWPIEEPLDALLCCNMIHIAPWPAAAGLMRGASQILSSGSALILYGPFAVEGVHTAPSNAQFDHSLRARNPAWGVRDTVDVDQIAQSQGLEFECHIPMPANNMIRVYRRTTA